MKSKHIILFEKSKSAMISAVEAINKPRFSYREEIFLMLCANAWELLVKAKWLLENGNKISSLYAKRHKTKKDGTPSKRFENIPSRSGNPITHEITYLIRELNRSKTIIDKNIIDNIKLIIEARDCVVHFYSDDFMLSKTIRELALASLNNYMFLAKEWFNVDLNEFGFSLLPISIGSDIFFVKNRKGE